MEDFRERFARLVENARSLVGNDDDTAQRLDAVFGQYNRGMEDLAAAIERGRCMEAFPT